MLSSYKELYSRLHLQSIIQFCRDGNPRDEMGGSPDERLEIAYEEFSKAVRNMTNQINSRPDLAVPDRDKLADDLRRMDEFLFSRAVRVGDAAFELGFYAGYTVCGQMTGIEEYVREAWMPTADGLSIP